MNERRMIPVKLDEYKPLRDVVFESMREGIIKQILKPGERLMEIQLAEEMGVSRTPVREAIRKLELEGFVVIVPRKGAYVASISLNDIHEVYEIRAALETLAAGLAAERATSEDIEAMEKCLHRESLSLNSSDVIASVDADVGLHDLIYRASKNSRLLATLNNLREQIYRTRVRSLFLPGRRKQSHEEHTRIVEAISSHDVSQAQKLLQAHIEHAEGATIEFLKGALEKK